ncbi:MULTISPECIES: DUF6471 domain-containing protein [unclassified Nitratiruptor]|uniref:DUF6471 domain-containing protein n=1 Tax=unclassified Nitratiruptor TaxID=2624044 RepID=UPI0019150646|nr:MULTISPECIES: DUF6471 domain-containing protein [unclassified Nitratiruptor]BCD59441.1 hypothetical protein NitYY0810_C0177 [Nitratiruptor sp. YY08-10]BCD63365.1 hypothetical protein NitYY0814_C0177 [Nitratiruptor sp. YY08-14]
MKEKAKNLLKSELVKRGLKYSDLAFLMKQKQYNENADAIRTKINRGTFSFEFFLKVLDAMDAELIVKDKDKKDPG